MSILQEPCSPIIIGVCGKKQSGKSTLCKYISDKIVPSSLVYAFADTLKELCINILGLTKRQCYGSDEDKNSLTRYTWEKLPKGIREKYGVETDVHTSRLVNLEFGGQIYEPAIIREKLPKTGFMTAREIFQIVGTDIFREMFSEDIWIDATFRKIRGDPEQTPQFAFISDVRFKSEVKSIIENDGYIIHLTQKVDKNDNHSSEVDLDDFDFSSLGEKCLVINNDGRAIEYKNKIGFDFVQNKIILGEIK